VAPALGERLARRLTDDHGVDPRDAGALERLVAEAPLAPPDPAGVLDLDGPLNPAHADALVALRERAVEPLLGADAARLDAATWADLGRRLAPYASWRAAEPAALAEGLAGRDPEALAADVAGDLPGRARELVARARAQGVTADDLRLVERAILAQRHLLDVANNFVSMPDLLAADRRALFERGTLVIDERRLTMAVPVPDRAEHAGVAATGGAFVLYAELTRKGADPALVACPVTAGRRGNLAVGKRGLFLDRDGAEWDARVVEVVENPISLLEAAWSPFARLGRAVRGRVEALGSDAGANVDAAPTGVVTVALTQKQQQKQPDEGAERDRRDRPWAAAGVLAGAGIALAALGSAAAFVASTLAALAWWEVLTAVVVVLAALLAPILLLAWLRLRTRDLSVLLEGAGWAISARLRPTRAQARAFTQHPPYPPGSVHPSHAVWAVVVVGLLVAGALIAGLVLAADAGPAPSPAPPSAPADGGGE